MDVPKIRYAQTAFRREEPQLLEAREKPKFTYLDKTLHTEEINMRYDQKDLFADETKSWYGEQPLATDAQDSTSSYLSPYKDFAKNKNRSEITSLHSIMQEQLALVDEIQKEKE